MKFYYDIEYKNGSCMGGHNCVEVKTNGEFLELKGCNVMLDYGGNCVVTGWTHIMWATFPNLNEALNTIKAWGFTYKTLGFSWIKTNKKNGKPFFWNWILYKK